MILIMSILNILNHSQYVSVFSKNDTLLKGKVICPISSIELCHAKRR